MSSLSMTFRELFGRSAKRSQDIPIHPGRRFRRSAILLPALAAFGLIILSAGIGAIEIAPGQVMAILADRIGLSLPWEYTTQQASVLVSIRLPRILLALLVGASLATSGGAMQGLFRNPLADPGLIGISSGAALAATATIVLGSVIFGSASHSIIPYTLPFAAFVGGLLATFLVYRISSVGGKVSVATMLLGGIAINALAGAATGIFTYTANDAELRTITFWGLGSLGGATWQTVGLIFPFIAIALIATPWLSRDLNALLLGEAEAGHLGTNVNRVKLLIVLLTALCIGASVAVTGVIGFVGLVIPHLLRLAIGPDHRVLLPASALLGGALLIGADLIARTIVAPAELPIGIVTATIGAPFFLWLLVKNRGGVSAGREAL